MIPRHVIYSSRAGQIMSEGWKFILRAYSIDGTRVERGVRIPMSKSSPTFLLTRANQRLNYSSAAVPLPSSKCHSSPLVSPLRSIASQIDKVDNPIRRSRYDTRNMIPSLWHARLVTRFTRHACKKLDFFGTD